VDWIASAKTRQGVWGQEVNGIDGEKLGRERLNNIPEEYRHMTLLFNFWMITEVIPEGQLTQVGQENGETRTCRAVWNCTASTTPRTLLCAKFFVPSKIILFSTYLFKRLFFIATFRNRATLPMGVFNPPTPI